ELVVVLDDGGRCIETAPDEISQTTTVIGIEQTTSGVHGRVAHTPIVDVATSAAKRFLEPSLIANAVFLRVAKNLPTVRNLRCGVIGLGNIGLAVARGLIDKGHVVHVTDLVPSKASRLSNVNWCASASEVLSNSDFVFGCTGSDVFRDLDR